MLISAIQLQAAHAEFVKVNRGGDITYHGPGQLVVYPIIDMANFGVGVKEYVDLLEEVIIRTVGESGLPGNGWKEPRGYGWMHTLLGHARYVRSGLNVPVT